MGTGLEVMAYASAAASAYSAISAADAPKVEAPKPPPQASKPPDLAGVKSKNAALAGGPMAGNSSTFLTGAGGVNPSSLNLGRNTLLGQ